MAWLQRHDLVLLTAEGWQQAIAQHSDASIRESLAHWASHGLPAVVATQGCQRATGDAVALGIATPPAWGQRRIGVQVAATELRCGEVEFPRWAVRSRDMPLADSFRAALDAALAEQAGAVRVYGSFGWEQITGLRYVTDRSDLDLLLEPADVTEADALAVALSALGPVGPRLDGELCFGHRGAVAWREWVEWRAGRVDRVLVKRVTGASLLDVPSSLASERVASSDVPA